MLVIHFARHTLHLAHHLHRCRNGRYASILASSDLATCDVEVVPTMYDTGSNAVGSITAYRAARADHLNPDNTNNLTAIVGCARSDASKPMATLGGIDKVRMGDKCTVTSTPHLLTIY